MNRQTKVRILFKLLFVLFVLDVGLSSYDLKVSKDLSGDINAVNGNCLKSESYTTCYNTYEFIQSFDTGIPLWIVVLDKPGNYSKVENVKEILFYEYNIK